MRTLTALYTCSIVQLIYCTYGHAADERSRLGHPVLYLVFSYVQFAEIQIRLKFVQEGKMSTNLGIQTVSGDKSDICIHARR